MKKITLICFIVFLFSLVVLPANAFNSADIFINNVASNTYYSYTFDNLVLDFALNIEESDVLNDLTLKDGGDASNKGAIDQMNLWLDQGPVGFQGFNIDKDLGKMTIRNFNEWYITGLSQDIEAGSRLFVSIVPDQNINDDYYIKMQMPALDDKNDNGVYDIGDQGIYLASGNNGPEDQGLANNSTQYLKELNYDIYAPKLFITNLKDGDVIDDDNFLIEGLAKEQGNSYVTGFKVIINDQEFLHNNYTKSTYTWTYDWQNIIPGEYTIQAEASDGLGNKTQTTPIIITVPEPVPDTPSEPSEPPADVIEPVQGLQFGDLVKTDQSSAVYYYAADGKLYTFLSLAVYKSWFGEDFSAVKTLTYNQIKDIDRGGAVTFKPGAVLVKITSVNKVYALDTPKTLRWLKSEQVAIDLFGADWAGKVKDIPDSEYARYEKGNDVEITDDFVMPESSIEEELGY